jgi:hypothetical protein
MVSNERPPKTKPFVFDMLDFDTDTMKEAFNKDS